MYMREVDCMRERERMHMILYMIDIGTIYVREI